MIIIDGKEFSKKILEEISNEQKEIVERKNLRPAGLAVIIVGENPASQVYVRNKTRACEKVGFYSETIKLEENISENDLIKKIEELNENDKIDGILVQLPLPKHIDELKVINSIKPEKDVDGFSNVNVGKMVIGDESGFLSCTPYGIMQLLEGYDIDVDGKDVVVVGRSNIVGKPMAMMLIQKGATVQVCNSRTKDLSKKLKKADIIVVAVGVPRMIKATDVKEGVVVIDVGINRVDGKLCGDVDYEDVAQKASYITPVPGGVGPMTIASLIKNTFISYQRKIY
ncbi:bifunctional methylenetetrahydrofolate dehydrogenase/methenyltetrahydrofolate cyclohydrolase FolD [Leptotrichia sp.]|jgi:tetrahydrofolate dehydrogenase/cyclohydrolase, NAD(P)-binding domain protein|uniref:bifunctional methylenetetrahydrofolate dehydrogenase/methenyltetrahydrofolate cyclohydrolase FolD n=1 Tax=Leptotrichia sp. TaxID=104608 RepID=UPI001854C4A3|nr:bifunctional methylenetetrahydrofolate dehydrogenase/methenyltetrahydrofolate cyclohydrolase FolD [Leptotrichia sp.]MBB1535621.1 bifunctional methylenetetrahydrofolate dehydrogenase/methenyltetrahydrofolate cyclohydrolase FolD [Leptotrichia sp.]